MNNRTAAASGDRRKALEVLRDTLAEQLDTTDKQIHAQLAAQYRATLLELESLSDSGKGSTLDELKQRRLAKGGGAASDASANA